jgi:hypothetical protein
MRINKKDLETQVEILNEMTGNALKAWERTGDGLRANIGTYVLDWAYGGVRLSQITGESGGQRDITGRATKAETYWRILAFRNGLLAQAMLAESK